MQRLAPYQSGLWLAEYLNIRCQLCRVDRSIQQAASSTKLSPDAHLSASSASLWRRRLAKHFNSGLLCSRCHQSIHWLPPAFTTDIAAGSSMVIQAASYYNYPLRQAVGAFKQSEDMTKLPLLVHALRQLPRPHGCHANNSVIVAMPTTDSRLIRRGFDPVTILSLYLSKHWQIPLWHGVQRIDNTVSQQGLSRAERLSNLDNAFMVTELPPVKRLLLFDDVATTGSSLQALARTLYQLHSPHSQSSPSYPANPQSFDSLDSNDSSTPSPNPYPYHLSAYAIAHGSSR